MTAEQPHLPIAPCLRCFWNGQISRVRHMQRSVSLGEVSYAPFFVPCAAAWSLSGPLLYSNCIPSGIQQDGLDHGPPGQDVALFPVFSSIHESGTKHKSPATWWSFPSCRSCNSAERDDTRGGHFDPDGELYVVAPSMTLAICAIRFNAAIGLAC